MVKTRNGKLKLKHMYIVHLSGSRSLRFVNTFSVDTEKKIPEKLLYILTANTQEQRRWQLITGYGINIMERFELNPMDMLCFMFCVLYIFIYSLVLNTEYIEQSVNGMYKRLIESQTHLAHSARRNCSRKRTTNQEICIFFLLHVRCWLFVSHVQRSFVLRPFFTHSFHS